MSQRKSSGGFMPPVTSDQNSPRSSNTAPLMLTQVPWSELESTGRGSPAKSMLPGPRELLASSTRFPQLPGPSITGLAHPDRRQAFATNANKIVAFEEQRGAPLNADQRKQLLTKMINGSLEKVGVPSVNTAFEPLPSSTAGAMSGDEWKMSLNQNAFAQPTPRRGAPPPPSSREQLSSLADTVYHEGRHAEQHYRAAQLLAAGGASSDEIQSKTGLPQHVSDQAFANPMQIPNTGRTPEMLEAEQWLHSFHGKDSEQRKETMRDLADSSLYLANATTNSIVKGLTPTSTDEERQDARKWLRTASDYHSMVHKEYTELPIEKDAWEVGGDIARRVKNGGTD